MGIILAYGGPFTGTRAVELSGKRRPHVLYFPTAQGDGSVGCQQQQTEFLDRLNCTFEIFWCMDVQPTRRQIRARFDRADVIVVGGGNTLRMMRRWKFLGVDGELLRAYRQGKVLSGGSAGSICWFQWGHSDSMHGYGHEPWDYIKVAGLGLLQGGHCPHYDQGDRRVKFHEMIRKTGGWGLALDEWAGLEVVDSKWRIIADRASANAYAVFRRNGEAVEQVAPKDGRYRPMDELYRLMRGEK